MANLDLQALPMALRAALDASFDDDESKRRAVLAPWADAGYVSIFSDGLDAWQEDRAWLLRRGAREAKRERLVREFFSQRVQTVDGSNPSIFDRNLPFFPTRLCEARAVLRSPCPQWICDAEFWALTMQCVDGDAHAAAIELRNRSAALDAAMRHSSLFGNPRKAALNEMTTLLRAWQTGDTPGL